MKSATMNDSSGDESSFDANTSFFDSFLVEEDHDESPLVDLSHFGGTTGGTDGVQKSRPRDNDDPFEDDRSVESIDLSGNDSLASSGGKPKIEEKGGVEGGLVASAMNSASDFFSNHFVTPNKEEEMRKEEVEEKGDDDNEVSEFDEEAGEVEPDRAAIREKAWNDTVHQQAVAEWIAKVKAER